MRDLFLMVGLGTLALVPASADIIHVTVNGSISGSGSAYVNCGSVIPTPPECSPVSPGFPPTETIDYSFAAQPGMFSDSGSASGVASFGSVEGEADQDVTIADNSISITMSASHTIEGAVLFYAGTESDSVTVDFDLTSPSEVTFKGGGTIFVPPPMLVPDAELRDSHGNVIVMVPSIDVPLSILLQPGSYEFSAGAQVFPTGGGPSGQGTFTDMELGFDASFGPVPTPEPRGAFFAALFLGLLVTRFVTRRPAA